MPKNIVLCLDGTGNQLNAKGNTNIVELFGMLSLADPEKQVGFYDPGVGTFSSAAAWTPVARWLSRLWGLAAGGGMKQNLIEAYNFVIENYEPGDHIYVFGFSRGAYTARALAGLICSVGIFRPGSENVVPYAVSEYMRMKGNEGFPKLEKFKDNFSRRVSGPRVSIKGHEHFAVQFLGLFDTVKAAGILRWTARFPWTKHLSNAVHVRHAVAIDEKRRPYRDYRAFWHKDAQPRPDIEEVWFAGVHSDVGGTFIDDSRLAKISLKWMVEGAWHAGVIFKPGAYGDLCLQVDESHANGRVHRMGWVWALLTYKRRKLSPKYHFHASVAAKAALHPKYAKRLPANATYVDPDWPDRKSDGR